MNRTAIISGALLLSLLFAASARAQEPAADAGGLYFSHPCDSVADNSAGHIASIGLRYAGNPIGVQGIQFTVKTDGRTLRMKRVEPGADLIAPGKWTIDYQIANAASGSELRVIAFGADTTVKIGPGDHPDLFRLIYDVDDIVSGAGGNRLSASMTLADVSSALAHRLGNSAGIGVAPVAGTLRVSVCDGGARGDLNGDERIDILGLLDLADALRGERTLESWQFNRADLAPWNPAWSRAVMFDDAENYGDGRIDRNDIALMSDAILRGAWPDGAALPAPRNAGTTDRSDATATLWCGASEGRMRVGIESDLPVKGAQIRLAADRLPVGITPIPGRDLPGDFVIESMVKDGELRLLIYSPGGSMIPAGAAELIELPGAAGNWSFAAPAVLAGNGNTPLSVRAETRGAAAGIESGMIAPAPLCSPNPFATSTAIRYHLDRAASVTLKICDASGREIARPLVDIRQEAGEHLFSFDAAGLPAGDYFCSIAHDGACAGLRLVVTR